MKKFYCGICGKYRKFKNLIISYIFEIKLVLFIICNMCKNEDKKIFEEKESTGILQILGLIENI